MGTLVNEVAAFNAMEMKMMLMMMVKQVTR